VAWGELLQKIALISDAISASAGLEASFQRRKEEWDQQLLLARKELEQLEQQRLAADARAQVATKDLEAHDKSVEQSEELDEFYRNKFTSLGLYTYLSTTLSRLYRGAYSQAYAMGLMAERAFSHERGVDASFIEAVNWQADRAGLLAGERLLLQLQQMETAWLQQNTREEYEITKHLSLTQIDPLALISLKETGQCQFAVPEVLFDLDFPGHYFRRIKSVGVTVPCVVGPYASVNAQLTLVSHKIRRDSTVAPDYREDPAGSDPRFVHTIGAPPPSIATSHGQSDSGLFELNLRDDRYLPFEGAGAISTWRLELSGKWRDESGEVIVELPQFDFDTISDVVLHLRYTARNGGEPLKSAAASGLTAAISDVVRREGDQGVARAFSLRHEFPTEWYRFVNLAQANGDHIQQFVLSKHRFPLLFQGRPLVITRLDVYAVRKGDIDLLALPEITPPGQQQPLDLEESEGAGRLIQGVAGGLSIPVEREPENADWTFRVPANAVEAFRNGVADIWAICHYSVE
jgi:hypothetical protein